MHELMFHPDALCQNGNCRRAWIARLNQPGADGLRKVHLCGNCADYLLLLRAKQDKGASAEKFCAGCHDHQVIVEREQEKKKKRA